jgi:hypothetical protein
MHCRQRPTIVIQLKGFRSVLRGMYGSGTRASAEAYNLLAGKKDLDAHVGVSDSRANCSKTMWR